MKNSRARRSCQTAMYHIIQALTRWLAPILSFTAEEIWRFIPGNITSSVFLSRWYDAWPSIDNVDLPMWQQLQLVRDEVNKALEIQRQQGVIGSGLAAKVTVYAQEPLLNRLLAFHDELRFLLITSEAIVKPLNQAPAALTVNKELGIAIDVEAVPYEKCDRCWHRRQEVGQDPEHPLLCQRCISVIQGVEEARHFA